MPFHYHRHPDELKPALARIVAGAHRPYHALTSVGVGRARYAVPPCPLPAGRTHPRTHPPTLRAPAGLTTTFATAYGQRLALDDMPAQHAATLSSQVPLPPGMAPIRCDAHT
jgi:hypothetical protein